MLTIASIPILLKITGKIDLRPIKDLLKDADIFEQADNAEGLSQLSKEKVGALAFDILAEFTPQLGKIADDIPPLVAAYKGISVEEAMKLDAFEVIGEIIHDKGITDFFGSALKKKAELAY